MDDRAWRLRKARTLVKVLALAPGRRLHREQVMELLWPELTATAAQNNLHQALHAARRAIGADCISLGDGMLSLDTDLVCDVDRFEQCATDARECVDVEAYGEALALYGGELLPEDRYETWAEPRRSSLRELHATLALDLARLQPAEDAVLTLQRALAAAPLHEPAHRALMGLYDQLGRRQEALAQFHRLRDALRSELEADPDHETRSLYRELLTDAEIGPSAPPLPVQLTSFVGRDRELHEVLELLERSRLLTLTGPGGSGKTRLALAAAERAGARDDIWFAELGSIFDPALVAEATATVIGIRVPSRRTAAEAVAEHLAHQSSLLVLDTCEHVIGACAALAETILRVCPQVTILATSREPLRSPGETTWRVPGLALPDPDASTIDEAESVQLLVARARDADPSFRLHEGNAADVAAICIRLDGMPLALELAAARVSALSVAEIAARLGDSLDVLSAGTRTALTRQQTLRATITWSHELLSGEERVLCRRLSVFAGTFSLTAAEDVCVGGPIERPGVADLLARLVDKSLVIADEGRYRLLDTIRQFASERLVDAAEVDAIEARLLAWAQRLAAAHDPETLEGAQNRSLEQLELEHDNVRAALDSGLRHDPQSALLLASRFWRFWLDRNFFTEGVRRVRAALHATPEATELRARAVLAASALELRSGELSLLVASAREAEALARNSANPTFAADVLHRVGALYVACSTLPACTAACADALALVEAGPAATRASIIGVSSIVPFYVGEFAEARRQLNATLDELDRVPDGTPPFFEGVTYGFAVLPEGPGGALRPIWEETIMLFHRFAREPARAYTLCNLAVLERSEGNASAARAALDDALERFRALGDHAGEALALAGLGNWARTFGDPDSALDWLERARELRRRHGDRRAVAMTEIDLALALAFGDDLKSARVLFAELGERFRAADDAPGQGGVLVIWGIAEERAGNLERAAELVRHGAEIWEPHLGGHLAGWAWLAAGDMYDALGGGPAAERSVGRAEGVLAKAGDVRGLGMCRAHPAAKSMQRSGKDALS